MASRLMLCSAAVNVAPSPSRGLGWRKSGRSAAVSSEPLASRTIPRGALRASGPPRPAPHASFAFPNVGWRVMRHDIVVELVFHRQFLAPVFGAASGDATLHQVFGVAQAPAEGRQLDGPRQ